MQPMAAALEGVGVAARIWPYVPTGSIAGLAGRLAAEVGHERGLHLIGHSLGGIIVTAAALGPLAGQVASVTTINAPFRGTWISYTGGGHLAGSLRWGSPILNDLRTRLARDLARHEGPSWRLLSALGDFAAPATTALTVGVSGDRLARRVVPVSGHSVSLMNRRMIDHVGDHITKSGNILPA